MAGAVGDVLVVVGSVVHELQDQLDDLLVVLLAVGADEVGLADAALLNDVPHGVVVVQDMDPVAHVLTGAVEPGALPVDEVGDLAGDELLDVLVGPVVVRAVGDRGLHAEGAHPGAHEQVASGLGRGVGGGGVVGGRRLELRRVVQLQVPVDLVGGDVVEAHLVAAHRLQEGEGTHEVGLDEGGGVAQRVVIV